jgi:hypothetical protein
MERRAYKLVGTVCLIVAVGYLWASLPTPGGCSNAGSIDFFCNQDVDTNALAIGLMILFLGVAAWLVTLGDRRGR